ncbi:MAG: DUF368 domain-containing protein [Candidatus Coproplasma sp.]
MMKAKEFLLNMLKGAAIGVAMLIPGVSGGTLAVLLGVYDKIIDSLGGITKNFKASILFLLPIALGAVLAFAAMLYPINLALEYAPFPTIMLFAGFMLGSCPDMIMGAKKDGFKKYDIASVLIPLAVVVGICFIPNMGNVDLSSSMPWYTYLVLAVMGILASCALVVPGISGSMLLLIFGYYQPILDSISALKTDFGHSLLVLTFFAVGVVIGFFTIAKLMQLLLSKFHRATMWAIVGFVIGSIPAVIISFFFNPDYGVACLNNLQIGLGVATFIVGGVATFFLAYFAKKKQGKVETVDISETDDKAKAEASATDEKTE